MTEPNGLNVKMAELLEQLTSPTGIFVTQTNAIIGQLSGISTTQVGIYGILLDIAQNMDQLMIALGAIPTAPEDTILALLHSIMGNTETNCNQRAPDPTDPQGCASPFISIGMTAAPDYGGRTFATWNMGALPDGVAEGDFLEFPVPNAQLVHSATGIWLVYVLSCASSSFSISPDLPSLYPTGQWVDISANLDMAFNVPAGADIEVFLCTPAEVVWTDCASINSQPTTYVTNQPFELACEAIFYDGVPGADCATDMSSAGSFVEGFSDPCGVLVGDLGFYLVQLDTSGLEVRLEWVLSGARDGVNLGPTAPTSISLPAGATSFLIANVGTGGAATVPFSVTICPPPPE